MNGLQLPPQTVVNLRVTDGNKTMDFVSFVLGPSRYGIRFSLPQILNKEYSLPVSTPIECSFVYNNKLLTFTTHVMGYEQTVPVSMVVAEPQTVTEGNRRKSVRYHWEMPISYIADVADGSRSVVGERTHTYNVSHGGVAIETTGLLPRGTSLTMSIDVGDQTLTMSGRVIWSGFKGRKAIAGIQFENTPDTTLRAWSKFLLDLEREHKPSAD